MGWGGEGRIAKENKKSFKSDRYVHYLDCDDDFTGVYVCQDLPIWILYTCSVYCIAIISQ